MNVAVEKGWLTKSPFEKIKPSYKDVERNGHGEEILKDSCKGKRDETLSSDAAKLLLGAAVLIFAMFFEKSIATLVLRFDKVLLFKS